MTTLSYHQRVYLFSIPCVQKVQACSMPLKPCWGQFLLNNAILVRHECKTIWRSFYSCNNYSMPKSAPSINCRIAYWYGSAEKRPRKWDIAYIRKMFPYAQIIENAEMNHAEFLQRDPALLFIRDTKCPVANIAHKEYCSLYVLFCKSSRR